MPRFERNMNKILDAFTGTVAEAFVVTPPMVRRDQPAGSGLDVGRHVTADAEPYAKVLRRLAAERKIPVLDLRQRMWDRFTGAGQPTFAVMHPPGNVSKEPDLTRKGREPVPKLSARNPLYFSQSGADSLAHWIVMDLRAMTNAASKLLRPFDGPPSPATSSCGAMNSTAKNWMMPDGPAAIPARARAA